MRVDDLEQYPKHFFEKAVTPEKLKAKWPNITELAIAVIMNDLHRQLIAKCITENER